LDEDCVIAKILDSWTFGVVMDFGGTSHSESSPKVFAICTNPEKYRCNPEGCDSIIRHPPCMVYKNNFLCGPLATQLEPDYQRIAALARITV
jgi:hypothetical protein